METQPGFPAEEVGVAPEIVEEALRKATTKLLNEVRKVREAISGIRRAIESRRDLFLIRMAGTPREMCYAAVDSGFTAPAIELVGGYLGIVLVTEVLYGSRCGGGGIDVRAYVDLWFNDDLTNSIARYYERLTTLRLLERKRAGEVDFDVLLIDGEIIPRTRWVSSGGRSGRQELLSKVVDLTGEVLKVANETDTAVVGVLKRSYSRDIVNILGFSNLKLSDKAVISLVLEEGEYLISGDHFTIRAELEKLTGMPGVRRDWLRSRLEWYESLVNSIPVGYTVKLAFYRAPRTIYPTATKVEYVTSDTIDEETLLSNLVHISSGTGIPAPVDYADNFSNISRELKQTVYNKLLAELAKSVGSKEIVPLLSLINPEKLRHIIG